MSGAGKQLTTVDYLKEAEHIVSNMEGATQVGFSEQHNYRDTLVLNVKTGLELTVERLMADYCKRAKDAEAQAQKLREALCNLANEISGLLGRAELAIREEVGHTNVNILLKRLGAARLVLGGK